MISLFIGIILLFTQQTDTTKKSFVLHDSLATGKFNTIELGNLDNWNYYPGDDSTWADPELDDSNWYANPLATSDTLWPNIAWQRKTISVDSTFDTKPRILSFNVTGAAVLYINGKLVAQSGVPSATPEGERLRISKRDKRPIVTFNPGEKYVLAVRNSFHSYDVFKFFAATDLPRIKFELNIEDYEGLYESTESESKDLFIGTILWVFFLMVALLHLFMHFRFKEEKGNLWVFIISSLYFFVVTFIVSVMFEDILPTLLVFVIGNYIGEVIILTFTLLPISIGRLLNINIRKVWLILPFATPLFALINHFQEQGSVTASRTATIILVLLILVGIIDSIIQAKKLKRKDVLLIAAPFIGLIVLFLLTPALRVLFGIILNGYLRSAWLFLMAISIPLGLSVYQMKRFFTAHGELESEVKERTSELEKSLNYLKSTQTQLIQAEKMASLGELTAGIAHEIQNPLNFVNNFSELNKEMLEELKEEIEKGDLEEIRAIANDVISNEEKINHHGKRADEIVKGMLAHSRTGKGEKVLTDLNKLADEYLRLSYHGLRAKDKSFNAKFETDFDSALPIVNAIPQDIGRVLLNLINNAFQASATVEKPLVQVATRKTEKGIEISVSDNGPGIPDSIKDKIFQPFFTTKPTGQGTGLGLSLSYDIIKAHGGELTLTTIVNEKTVFYIKLPY